MDGTIANAGNVTALRLYQKPMKNPILVELLDHWERLRAGRVAPLRSEIDPRQIENALAHAFILEKPRGGDCRFRIVGMKVCDLMGMEVRGMPAASLIAPTERDRFNSILNKMFETPEIIELTLTAGLPGRRAIRADMLLLPMTDDQGRVSRILGCVVADGSPVAPPYRFSIVSQKVTRIVALKRLIPGTGIKSAPAGFAENPQTAFVSQPPPYPRPKRRNGRSHLTLVKSDD